MLEIREVTRNYQKNGHAVTALDGISATVGPGEFVSVVGPSGSGKTTLLLTLGGLATPTAGEVVLNGTSLYELSPGQRARVRLDTIGFVFQTFNLLPYLSALDNVCVPLALAGKTRREQRKCAEELLTRMGLSHRLTHTPPELSVGECQRVALARALANEPAMLLADEPTGNLDPECSEEIIGCFESLAREGKTIVMVTHDHDAARRAPRSMRLVGGRLFEPVHDNVGA